MKRAAIYMRVSTANQEQEQTIEGQELELLKRVSEDDALLSPDNIYKDDGWSGTILMRPEMDRMRQDAADGKFDTLYFYDRGRISRLFIPQELVLDELRKNGIEIIGLHDINDPSMEGQMMGKVLGVFHEYERLKITERMRLGKLRKVEHNGKLLGYNPKFGYDYHARVKGVNSHDGYFTVNSDQAEVVRTIFDLYGNRGLSKYAVRAELFKRNIMPAKGRSNQWSTGVIDRMLRDETYIGKHHYNKTESRETVNPRKYEKYRKTLKGSRVARPKEDWMAISVPAIVDTALFNRVQVLLERNKRLNSRNNKKNNYLLSGIIQCACGFARTGDPANGHTYYRCTDRLNHATGQRFCYEKSINSAVLDELIWKKLQDLLSNPDLVGEYVRRWKDNKSPIEDQIGMLKNRLKTLNEQVDRLLTLFTTADITEKEYRTRKDEIVDHRDKLVYEINELENLRSAQPSLPLEKLVSGVVKLLQEPDFPTKREIVEKVITKVVATQKEVNVWGFIPLLPQTEVGLNVKHRNRRPSERWKVYLI